MGESHSLFRIVLFLGFVLLMGSVLATPWVYVGQPLPSNSAWGQFSNGIQNFPKFDNPFATASGATFVMHPVSSPSESGFQGNMARPASVTNPSNGTKNCYGSPPVRWDGCVLDGKANLDSGTFLTLNSTRPTVVVGMPTVSGIAGDLFVGSLTFYYTCRYTTTQYAMSMAFYDYTRKLVALSAGGEPACNLPMELHSFTITFVAGSYPTATQFNGGFAKLHSAIAASGPTVDVAEFFVAINPPVPTNCAGDTVCAINQGFQTILNIAVFIVNGVVFVFQVIFWFVGMVGIFFGALLSILSIPGAPPLITGLIGIVVIGCLFFVAIVIMGKIRGTGNVG